MNLVQGDNLRIQEDGWWKVPTANGEVDVLTTDKVYVDAVDNIYVYAKVYRDDTELGKLRIHHCFIKEDFEKVSNEH